MMRDGRFRIASVIVALLMVASLALGASCQSDLRAERAAAQKASRAQWISQADKDPHMAAHHGIYLVRPPSALMLFDAGVTSYTGSAILIEAHKQSEATLRAARDGGVAARFGEFSAAGVLQLLLPLLIILLGFGTFAGERENGTLRQVLALGVSRRDLAWGKALGIAGVLAVLLVPALLAAGAALLLAPGAQHAVMARAALLAAGYILYLGIFIALTLAVSARAQTSRGALVGLLGFWIFTSLFAPRLASDAVRALYPTPSAVEFAGWVDKAKDAERGKKAPREVIKTIQARLMKQHKVSKVEDLPVNWMGALAQQSEDGTNRAFDNVYARLWGTFRQQNAVYERAALASPLLGVRSISMALSQSDWEAHRHFCQSVETYRRHWVRLMNDDLTRHLPRAGEKYKAGRALWESIPDFEYSPASAASVLSMQKGSIAILSAWFVASLAAMLWTTRRMQV